MFEGLVNGAAKIILAILINPGSSSDVFHDQIL